MKPILPQELCDEIIDHLRDDKSTLGKCGLVCRFWLWSSRSHLFYTLVLLTYDIDVAHAILSAPGTTIPPHVRALVIIEDYVYVEWGPSWVNSVLPKLPQLTAVEKLSLWNIRWHTLTPEAKERLFTISRGLKSLELDMVFKTLIHALQLISSAPSLERLSVGRMNCQIKDTSLTKFSAPPIKHLTFNWNSVAPGILDWLSHWQPNPSVRNLTLRGISATGMPSVSAYIRRLGPALEHFEVNCYDGQTQAAALYKEIDLTHSTSLKTILIDGLTLCTESPESHTYDWIIDFLSQITSRSIERVTLVVNLNSLQELVPFNLPALAALFAHGSPTFSEAPTRLQFVIWGTVVGTEARAAIAEGLHELDSQGRLEFG